MVENIFLTKLNYICRGEESQMSQGEAVERGAWEKDVMTVSGAGKCQPWLVPASYQGRVQPLNTDG